MNQILRLISYKSRGQDGAILSVRDYPPCPARKNFPRNPCNKSFINQVCSVKMTGYWSRSLFCEFMDLYSVCQSINTKRNGPISSHVDLTFGQ